MSNEFELPEGWPDVVPQVATPRPHPFGGMYPQYYPADLGLAFQATRERIDEWDWDEDPHGYCHERPLLVTLLREISRLHSGVKL